MKKIIRHISKAPFYAMVLFLIACGSQYTYTDWEYDVSKYNLEFEKLRYSVEQDNGDTVSIIGLMKEPAIVGGFPCDADWIHFNHTWNVQLCLLSSSFNFQNILLEQGTWIRFSDTGNLICTFPKDTMVQGYLLRGNALKQGAKGIQTSFYSSGSLKGFYPVDDVRIGEVVCKATVFKNVQLHENGKLKRCRLAKKVVLNNEVFKKNTTLNLDETGAVIN